MTIPARCGIAVLVARVGRLAGRIALAALCAVLSVLLQLRAAHAESAIDQWRRSAAEVRLLGENDAPRAYSEALRLQSSLPAAAAPADRIRILNLLSRIESYLGKTALASSHARIALDLAKQHTDRIGQVEAYMNVAVTAIYEGKIQDLITSTTDSLEIINGIEHPALLGEALLRAGMMYMRIGQVDESIATCMKALEIARNANDPLALTYAHQCVAIAFSQIDRMDDAYDHYRSMRDLAHTGGSRLQEGFAMLGMANALTKLNGPQYGEAHIRTGINLLRSVGAVFAIAHGLHQLASHLKGQGRHAEALSLFNEALGIFERNANKIGLWYSLMARSETYMALGSTAPAQADAERAYALAGQIGLPVYISDSSRRLAVIAARQGDHRRAYKLSVEATEMTAKAAREKVSARVIELAQRYESESKRRKIEELTRRNEQQTAELKQRALQQRWLWTVLGSSLLMLGSTAFFLMRLRRSNSLIRTLNASLEQRVQERTAELRQHARYLRTLIDALPWSVWLKDTRSRYLALNQAAANPSRLNAADMLGKSDADFRTQQLAGVLMEDDREVMASRRSKTVEEVQSAAGGQVWMEVFKAPVLDEDGTVLGTVGFARDISERKAVEAAREAALAQAQRLAQLRSEFLAQMSHELRTPLNGIVGYAQILGSDTSLTPRQADGIAVIKRCGEHLLTLINDTLDLAKIEAGKLELYRADIILSRFLDSIAEMVRLKAEQKNVVFICDMAPDLPAAVRADERRLRQVLLNLLANAVKFTERGQVRLRVCFTPPSRLLFEVSDTGVGIDAEQLEGIFRPYEQSSQAQHRFGGTGLGLAISRQFVRLMGGEIRVESRVGEGSRFWFEVDLDPADAEAVEPARTERRVTGYEGARRTVLVVDDVAENRAVLVDMLGRLGFMMAEAGSGDDALTTAPAVKPDLVLMDVVLPDIDGLETSRRLRMLPGLNTVPIIAISASAFGDDEARSLAAGLNAFLPKPVEFGRLLERMAVLLDLRWCHAPEPRAGSREPLRLDRLEAPPPDEMEVLYRLARLGNMQDILERAAYLDGIDERYRPFAEQLRRMASKFQSKAITGFIEQYMKNRQEQPSGR